MALEYALKIHKIVVAWIWVVWCRIKPRYLYGKTKIVGPAVAPRFKDADIESISANGRRDDSISADATSATSYETSSGIAPGSLKTTLLSGNHRTSTTGRQADAGPNLRQKGHGVEDIPSQRRRATDPDTASVDLRRSLASIQKEVPIRDSRFFFPDNGLRRILVPENILTELKRTRPRDTEDELKMHSQIISEKAPRLFAILVWVELSGFICDIMSEGIDDSDLPFRRCDDDVTREVRMCSNKGPVNPIECMKGWIPEKLHNFNRYQHAVLSPVFHFGEEIKHQELHKECVLPFIEDHQRGNEHKASEGGYSLVSKVKIHPAHQIVDDQEDLETQYPYIALKCLYLPHEEYFKSEVAMLKKFRERKNPNLIRLLATFRYNNQYYLLFPYAQSDLRQYWERNPIPEFSFTSVQWFLHQCQALASGVDTVHSSTHTDMSSAMSTLIGRPDDLASRFNDDVKRYGRHGDIKPENILWFENGNVENVNCKEGSLVIADFGLADLHRRATVSEIPATSCTGTPTYEPPERQLGKKISRAYDVWCLGCTYLDFLTWLVCGWKVLQKFPDARRTSTFPNLMEDTFYHIPEQEQGKIQRAEICEGVARWMVEMRDLPRCSAFVDDFLNLISGEMLLVDPQQRVSARVLKRKLSAMLLKATKDPSYLTEPHAKQKLVQSPLINGVPTVYYLKDGTIRMPSRSEGDPLPKRDGTMPASRRLRSLSPPIQPSTFQKL